MHGQFVQHISFSTMVNFGRPASFASPGEHMSKRQDHRSALGSYDFEAQGLVPGVWSNPAAAAVYIGVLRTCIAETGTFHLHFLPDTCAHMTSDLLSRTHTCSLQHTLALPLQERLTIPFSTIARARADCCWVAAVCDCAGYVLPYLPNLTCLQLTHGAADAVTISGLTNLLDLRLGFRTRSMVTALVFHHCRA